MGLDDFLDKFNLIARLEGMVSRTLHWDKSAPFLPALLASASGYDEWTFHIRNDAGFTGGDAERLLNHYAIPIWCRRVTDQHFILSTPRRQANWAEYLLLRRGFVLDGALFNPDNGRYAGRHAPGSTPPAWADKETLA